MAAGAVTGMRDALGGGLRNIDWSQQKSIPFEKNFYVEDKRVSSRSDREIEEFRRLKEIKVIISIVSTYVELTNVC